MESESFICLTVIFQILDKKISSQRHCVVVNETVSENIFCIPNVQLTLYQHVRYMSLYASANNNIDVKRTVAVEFGGNGSSIQKSKR